MYGIIFLVVVGIIVGITLAVKNSQKTASPDNIARIKSDQLIQLQPRWTGITQKRKGIASIMNTIPEDQRLLINVNGMATRLTGFLGPYSSGVYDEDAATRLALSSGSRCLILEISHMMNDEEPYLIYRSASSSGELGFKKSLNVGSIDKVAQSIASRAFTVANDSVPPQVANDPLIVVLYFMNTPDPATNPREYVRFLGKVAEKLEPLNNLIVGQTPQGDFRKQALESQLFFTPYNVFSGKIIMLCNVDLTPFRRLDSLRMQGEIGAKQNLDLMVHARLYSKQSPSGLGATSVPANNVDPSAIITTPDYWLTTPPDRLADSQSQTKKAWTLVMQPTAYDYNSVTKDQLNELLTKYGVQAVPFCLFDKPEVTDIFTGKNAPYENDAWNAKPELIRFIPPKPIAIQKASPATNARGGFIPSPHL